MAKHLINTGGLNRPLSAGDCLRTRSRRLSASQWRFTPCCACRSVMLRRSSYHNTCPKGSAYKLRRQASAAGQFTAEKAEQQGLAPLSEEQQRARFQLELAALSNAEPEAETTSDLQDERGSAQSLLLEHPPSRVENSAIEDAAVGTSIPEEFLSSHSDEAETTNSASAASHMQEREVLRRLRISEANRGKRPWNYGRKHSQETRLKIKERTKLAMQRPEVIERMRQNFSPKLHTEETKAKIAQSLRDYREMKEQVLGELVNQETEASLAAALNLRDQPEQRFKSLSARLENSAQHASFSTLDTEKLISTATARKLTEHFSLDRIQQILKAARTLLAQTSDSDSSGEDEEIHAVGSALNDDTALQDLGHQQREIQTPGQDALGLQENDDDKAQEVRRQQKAAEHRAKIAESIRRKWADPQYRARVLAGSARAASLSKGQEQSASHKVAVVPAEEKPRRARSASTKKPKQVASKKAKSKTVKPKRSAWSKIQSSGTLDEWPYAIVDVKLPKAEVSPGDAKSASHAASRAHKLQVAARLVAEMEAALAQFSDEDLDDDSPEVQQSVQEAHELLLRAKTQVLKLSRGAQPLQGSDSKLRQREPGFTSDDLEQAMLALNMD